MKEKIADILSDAISPLEIKNKEFKRVPLGYSPQEVVSFLDLTAKAWERVQKNETKLVEEIRRLKEEIEGWKSREAELVELKNQALRDADKVKAEALEEAQRAFLEVKGKSEEIKVKTEEWLAKVIRELEQTQQRKQSFITAFRSALDQHYAILNDEVDQSNTLETNLSRFLSEANASHSGEATNLECDPRLS